MAFWGIEVKPGNPVTHSCEKARGRLRVSQATLGIGEATKKSVVQCNVGNRRPVLLCVLLPNSTESCHLDLEFEEADDVVFSVIGPRTVYLTGYYVQQSRHSAAPSDSESYGVDIQNSQTDGSSYRSDDDKYEDSFIDDDAELQVSPASPVSSSKEDGKPKGKKGRGRKLKKKYQVIESDTDTNSLKGDDDDDDDDGFLLSVFKSKKAAQRTESQEENGQVTEEMGDKAKTKSVCGSKSNEKVGSEVVNGRPESEAKPPSDDKVTQVKNENNEPSRKVETIEEVTTNNEQVSTYNKVHENMEESNIIHQKLPMSSEKDQMQSLDLAKPKKKRKQRSKEEEKTSEVEIGKDHNVLGGDKEHEAEASKNMESGANILVSPPELGPKKGQKSKKRKKELLEGTHTEAIGPECHNIAEDDKLKQGLLQADITMEDLPAANGEHKDQQIDNNVTTKSELLANGSQPEKKKKKKIKKKSQGDGDLNMGVPNTTDDQETTVMKHEDQASNETSIHKRTLSNGLAIEVLANGPPDGKVAAPGKKVKVYYTAMLKESGHIFDKNVSKTPYKFRLGDKEVLKGLNVGIDGMHVGEKRRLTIPPSMGYGNQGGGENVPPDSWLVYDVELVGVLR